MVFLDSPKSGFYCFCQNTGITGFSQTLRGVEGISPFRGISGITKGQNPNRTAIYGYSASSGFAGYYVGEVQVIGTLTNASGSFRIDHPLNSANKYLDHSFVESPDIKNIYDGVVTTNEEGIDAVDLSEWFEGLNIDFRNQLAV